MPLTPASACRWPHLDLQMSHIACTEEDRKHGLFMLVDSLEFGGMEAAAYLPQYTPILQACAMDSKSAALRQAAA